MEVATNCYPKLRTVIKDPESFSKQLSAFEAVYNSMEIGAYNPEVLSRISKDGLAGILTEYKNKVNEEIESSGIKSKRLKGILLQSYDEASEELQNAVNLLIEEVETQEQAAIKSKILSQSLKYKSSGFEKQYGASSEPGNEFKRLTIGRQSWIATECGKSWGFQHCTAMFKPGLGDTFLYAKCPVNTQELAELLVSYEPLPNTSTDYLILIQTKPYSEVDFNY